MKHPLVTSAFLCACLLTACAAAPRQRGEIKASDGTPIVFAARGHGEPALVMIHCWCGNRSFWNNQIDELARDHQVITFDLPGHGESGHDRKHWSIDGLGADVAQLADAL